LAQPHHLHLALCFFPGGIRRVRHFQSCFHVRSAELSTNIHNDTAFFWSIIAFKFASNNYLTQPPKKALNG
jgi:hypothetical protein